MSKKIKYRFTKYKKREITFFEVLKIRGWNIKVYGINLDNKPDENIMNYLQNMLPIPALTEFRYGMGFLIIHKGVVGNWFLLNWWGYEDIVHQKIFKSPIEDFNDIKPIDDDSILACVHELDIYNFESNAWKRHVLSTEKSSFQDYLNSYLH
jgi:hypothetical protein